MKTKSDILNEITAEDASAILRILVNEDKDIRMKIEQIAKEFLREVGVEAIASEVYSELNILEVENLWDQSGSTSYGYIEPAEKAVEMFEEILKPFIEKLVKYKRLSMDKEAKTYCMGVLKGIYQYEKESTSEFKNWPVDVPRECFGWVLDEWKKGQKSTDILEVRNFIKKNLPDWGNDISQSK